MFPLTMLTGKIYTIKHKTTFTKINNNNKNNTTTTNNNNNKKQRKKKTEKNVRCLHCVCLCICVCFVHPRKKLMFIQVYIYLVVCSRHGNVMSTYIQICTFNRTKQAKVCVVRVYAVAVCQYESRSSPIPQTSVCRWMTLVGSPAAWCSSPRSHHIQSECRGKRPALALCPRVYTGRILH